VALAVLPTKGLTLPFVSFGGSSLLVNAVAAGILLNISRQSVRPPSEATPEPVLVAPSPEPGAAEADAALVEASS
jgi:cell division protein FtsW